MVTIEIMFLILKLVITIFCLFCLLGSVVFFLRGISPYWPHACVCLSTARVIFTAKTSLDVFSLSREQVWTFSSLG